ncbi:MAG: hypothetical protein MZU97_14005 [Bacillus subtilis]|nr:hypothetical protein [Bacillus subtilis]
MLAGVMLAAATCGGATTTTTAAPVETTLNNPIIYEVNIRNYTEEGTFDAFENIFRGPELGVDILWLMPIHPISETTAHRFARQLVRGRRLLRGEPEQWHRRGLPRARRGGPRDGLFDRPRLGRQPHRLGQPVDLCASGPVYAGRPGKHHDPVRHQLRTTSPTSTI